MKTEIISDRIAGEHGFLTDSKGLKWPVIVLDTRASFGRVDFLIQPVGGEGQIWVQENRVTRG